MSMTSRHEFMSEPLIVRSFPHPSIWTVGHVQQADTGMLSLFRALHAGSTFTPSNDTVKGLV